MDQQLKSAFDAVQASERLKRMTRAAVRKKTFDYGRDAARVRAFRRRLAGALAAIILCVGGGGLWFLPVTGIGLDINPSLELRVNLLDRVVGLEGRNADGERLVSQLEDLRGMPYADAMQRILVSDHLQPYLEAGLPIVITVVGASDAHGRQMLSQVVCRAYGLAEKNTVFYCRTDRATAEAARASGLTAVQYRAWKRLSADDPSVTAESVRAMDLSIVEEIAGLEKLEDPCGE